MIYTFKDNQLTLSEHKENVCSFISLSKLDTPFSVNLSELIKKEAKKNEHTFQVELYKSYLFGTLHINGQSFTEDTALFFVLEPNHLTIIYNEEEVDLDGLVKEINIESEVFHNPVQKIEFVLYFILKLQMIKDRKITLEIGDEVENLEDDLLEDTKLNYEVEILSIRKKLLYLKKNYSAMLFFAETLKLNTGNQISQTLGEDFLMLDNQMNRILNEINTFDAHILQLREMYQSQLDVKLNKTMNFFTVISAIFLPLTLVVGWYGMNFTMPEYEHARSYWIFIGINSIVVGWIIYIIRKRGYLKK